MAILFHLESKKLKLVERTRIKSWLKDVLVNEGLTEGKISVILTSENKLLELNREFLSRDYHTDIITFDYTVGDMVSGDIFVSVERIIENAEKYSVNVREELLRILVHGILHLAGYRDDTKSEKALMREKENHYLHLVLNAS